MLVIKRKLGESIIISKDGMVILEIKIIPNRGRNSVFLGFLADENIGITRKEAVLSEEEEEELNYNKGCYNR